jgi:hypothetical protein
MDLLGKIKTKKRDREKCHDVKGVLCYYLESSMEWCFIVLVSLMLMLLQYLLDSAVLGFWNAL